MVRMFASFPEQLVCWSYVLLPNLCQLLFKV